jgi:hypothetical protein
MVGGCAVPSAEVARGPKAGPPEKYSLQDISTLHMGEPLWKANYSGSVSAALGSRGRLTAVLHSSNTRGGRSPYVLEVKGADGKVSWSNSFEGKSWSAG